MGNHISGGGGKFDAFFICCVYVLGVVWNRNLEFGVNPPEDSLN